MSKPIEFWIYDNGEEPCLAFQDYTEARANQILPDELTHVIEKSAYDKKDKQLKIVSEAFELLIKNDEWHTTAIEEINIRLRQDLDVKEKQLKLAVEALKQWCMCAEDPLYTKEACANCKALKLINQLESEDGDETA